MLNESFPAAAPWIRTVGSSGGGSFCFRATRAVLGNNLRSRETGNHRGTKPPFFLSSPGSAMGKEQELLEAARTGNLAAVEKLLSGKRQSAGIGSGLSGIGGSGTSGGHGASSHPLSSLLR